MFSFISGCISARAKIRSSTANVDLNTVFKVPNDQWTRKNAEDEHLPSAEESSDEELRDDFLSLLSFVDEDNKLYVPTPEETIGMYATLAKKQAREEAARKRVADNEERKKKRARQKKVKSLPVFGKRSIFKKRNLHRKCFAKFAAKVALQTKSASESSKTVLSGTSTMTPNRDSTETPIEEKFTHLNLQERIVGGDDSVGLPATTVGDATEPAAP